MSDQEREFQRLVLAALASLMTACGDDMPSEMQRSSIEWFRQVRDFHHEFLIELDS